jgi:hypothetical protein
MSLRSRREECWPQAMNREHKGDLGKLKQLTTFARQKLCGTELYYTI